MPSNIDPLAAAEAEARGLYQRIKARIVDWGWKYVTLSLAKVVLPGLGAIALAIVALPAFAAAACCVVIALLVTYAVYSTRLLKRVDAELRWAWIASKRLEQRNLDQQIATDRAILEIMGERGDHRDWKPYRAVPQDLKSAMAHVRGRLAEAGRASRPQPPGAATRAPAVPSGPAIAPIKARLAAREAERAALSAEIESLATPGDIEQAMKAEDAERTKRERQDAATAADREARDRVRRGLSATTPEAGQTIRLGVKPNGDRDMSTRPGSPTPEQIAQGGDAGGGP